MNTKRLGSVSTTIAITATAILFALAIRMAGAYGKELWLDELHSAAICSRPLSEWVGPGALGGYTPLYFVLSAPFSRMGTDFLAKVVSIFSGTLMLLAVPTLLRGTEPSGSSPPRRSLILGLLFAAIAPSLIVFSSYHRMYALYALLITATWISWGRPGRVAAAGTVIFACVAFLTFPYASIYVAALTVYALFIRHHRGRAVAATISVLLLGLFWSAQGLRTISTEATSSAVVSRFPGITPMLYVQYLKFLMAGPVGGHHPHLRTLAMGLLCLALVVLIDAIVRAVKGDRVRLFLLHGVLLPPMAEFVLLAADIRMFQFKSYLPGALPLLLLTALFFGERTHPVTRRLAAVFSTLLILAMSFITAAWIDPSQPFSMNESRGDRQRSLLEFVNHPQPALEDTGALAPLVLGDPSALLGALRYGPAPGTRVLLADENLFHTLSVPGRYRELMLAIARHSSVQVIKHEQLPRRAFWLGLIPPTPHAIAASSNAGLKLYYSDPDHRPGEAPQS